MFLVFRGGECQFPSSLSCSVCLFLLCLQILTIPVKALIAVGTLNSSPKNIILPPAFPVSNSRDYVFKQEEVFPVPCVFCLPQGKVVHQSFNIQSSFTQKVRLQQIQSLTDDIRFYYKRLRNNKDELEPRRKSKVENPLQEFFFFFFFFLWT